MKTGIDLDEFLPTMDAPDKVYQLFESLGFKVLDSHLKTNPSVYNLPVKEAALVEKIYAVSNYDRRFQILLFKLKAEGPEQSRREAIRTIPEKILREVDFPFIIFTPDFKTYTFTLVEKVREGPGEFKRKLTKLVVDSSQPYHTDKEILASLALSVDTKNPVEVYKLFQSAFSVEKVTKKFFTEYREVFERLVGEVTKQNKHLKFTLFSRDGSVENFVKILLGRLMFLYFIQKRGWLNCFDGWGSGDKKFLYIKFQEAKKEKKNYFKDYLEPLFFDTLNNPRRDKPDQATQFGGRIPFLNGGLFEPEYDYQDVRNHILLENSTFDDVFSVFEKYNFTVKEDEPLEKEVAIDPEMLGKVFENLLEENLRKGKGTYYTPREIVHYMCHESIINYLSSEVSLDQDVIRNFLDREQSLEKKETLSSAIREKAREIDEKLADIKVLDPACGSGAFLVGMLHEVINARLSLNRELGRSLSEYELKKATIQNNIYGVDIDPGASEIAKLRLWLTLVVDHNLSEIEPLPNLDYKIMVGNSLLDEFMGVKLFNPENAKGQTNAKKMLSLFDEDLQVSLFENDDKKTSVLKALQGLHALYFKESDPEKKKQIRTRIDKIEFDLIEATVNDEVSQLERKTKGIVEPYLSHGIGIPAGEVERISKLLSQQAQILETFNEIKKSNVKPFFLFQLHFSDVFERKGGFDVVIANPPYEEVSEKSMKATFQAKYSEVLSGHYDLFIFFIKRGADLLREGGSLSFIVPHTYLHYTQFHNLRKWLYDNMQIVELTQPIHNIFQAVVDNSILFVKNSKPQDSSTTEFTVISIQANSAMPKESSALKHNEFNDQTFDYQGIQNLIKLKRFSADTMLLGDVIDSSQGITVYAKVQGAKINYFRNKQEDKYSKPLVKGKDVFKYYLDRTGAYIQYGDWLWCPRNPKFFENKKIFLRQTSDRLIATYVEEPMYCIDSVHSLINKEGTSYDLKYVLAILNSNLGNYLYQLINFEKDKVFAQVKLTFLRKIPIKKAAIEEQQRFISYVDKIIALKKSREEKDSKQVLEYEKQIDQLVYKLYGLTPEEITVVEGK